MSIFGDLERFLADLYPYRWPITIGLIAALAVLAWIGYRNGVHRFVWRHKLASALAAAVFLSAVVPLGNYLLSPLWERTYLDEASPLAEAVSPATAGGPTGTPQTTVAPIAASPAPNDQLPAAEAAPEEPIAASFEPAVVRSGAISGADDFHFGEGDALLIETAPNVYALRFEEFSVRNGPDLFVYLTPDSDSVDGAINLGELKATDGAFNYEVPPGTDVAQFNYAIVWCREFAVLFASAPLE
jgi:hypothetical protein